MLALAAASLPQVFFPAVCATRRGLAASLGAGPDKVYGPAALQPSVRANSTLTYPIRPSERISKVRPRLFLWLQCSAAS